MDLRPGQQIDRYRVESVIASGGMATVYRVRHTTLDTLHALKVLLLPAKHLMERLIQEGKAQARLKHPNIVAVTDVVEVNGAPGLVMELIEGPSLHELVRAQRLTIDQADALGRDIIRAVAHAHDHGMIHRDLKPANVMLAIDRGELIPKVTDFGLAKLLTLQSGTDKTASGLAMGTPSYMAPEQYRDAKNVDRRADVFSLGTILFEMVAGQRCFAGEEMIEVYQNIVNGVYPDPRTLVEGLPERMADAIEGALETDPEDRLADCDALLEVWCATTMTRPRRSSAHPGTWSADLLDEAAALASATGGGPRRGSASTGALGLASDEDEADGETRMPPPTLDPGSNIGSSETIYASLAPKTAGLGSVPPLTQPPTGPSSGSDPAQSDARGGAVGPLLLGIVFLLGLTVPAALGIGVYLGGGFDPEPELVVEPAPIDANATKDADAPAPEPTPAPPPAPVEAPAPIAAPAPARPAPVRPAPVRPEPKPEPAPAAAATGTVVLEGDGTARLRDENGGHHPIGKVPEGTYSLLVTFEGKSEREKGTIVVRKGSTSTANCSAAFNRCKIR